MLVVVGEFEGTLALVFLRDQSRKSARQDHGRNGAKAHKTARVRVQIALDATMGRKSIKNARRDGGRKYDRQ